MPSKNRLVHPSSALSLRATLLQKDAVFYIQQLFVCIKIGFEDSTRLAHAMHDAPRVLRFPIPPGPGRRCSNKHRRAIKHRSDNIMRNDCNDTAACGDEIHQHLIFALASRHENAADRVVASFIGSTLCRVCSAMNMVEQ